MKRRNRTRTQKRTANASRDDVPQSLRQRIRRFLDVPLSSTIRITRLHTLGVVVIALLVAVAYFPATQAGFVWDDFIFVDSSFVQELSGIRVIWITPSQISNEGHYWPMVYTTFWVEYRLWGLNPTGYHVVNVLLHLVPFPDIFDKYKK